jgi:NAD(P)-dependent dehydrogenase (short-subunit alcohol dehydrogenase family)
MLKDKVALITGAGSGIGRAIAATFAHNGARIVVADINDLAGQQTVDLIRQLSGDAIFVHADVGLMSNVKALVEAAVQHYGHIDILVSNAAYLKMGSSTEINEEDWDRTLSVSLKATWMLAHCAIPGMLAHGGGVIVITGSVHALRGYTGYAAYQASKGGLLALTRSLAADYGPTIRANSILPGAVVTEIRGRVSEEERTRIANMCPLRRNGKPEDIAQVALFLASDMSSFVTGTYVIADGGVSSVVRLS